MIKNLESDSLRCVTQNNAVPSDGVYVKVLPNTAFTAVQEANINRQVESLIKDRNTLLGFVSVLKSAARIHAEDNTVFNNALVEAACVIMMNKIGNGLSGT